MAGLSDVNLTVSGLPGVTPVGVVVSYSVGAIPTASIDLAPAAPGVIKISGAPALLADVDSFKRSDVSVQISVSSRAGAGKASSRSLKFDGVLDGVSIGNIIGGNYYQAVVKNKAQSLLEITTMTPGLHPASVNIYRSPSFNLKRDDEGKLQKFHNFKNPKKDSSPIEYYHELIKWLVKTQSDGSFLTYTGLENRLAGNGQPFKNIFTDQRYKKSLIKASKLIDSIDLSAISGGVAKEAGTGVPLIVDTIGRIFAQGPDTILENYLNFLSTMGCSFIYSNNKIFAVPVNSVIKPDAPAPSYRQLQTKPNQAFPADYNNYTYNDNGFRDIGAVIVVSEHYVGGQERGQRLFDRGTLGHFKDTEKLSKASGVLVVRDSVWHKCTPIAANPKTTATARKSLDEEASRVSKSVNLEEAKQSAKRAAVQDDTTKQQEFRKNLNAVIDNYAEIKLYQERYKDRQGSITMDFNPYWVPGTSGTLFIRETGVSLAFYVVNVTHNISMHAPNSGNAVTTINFCCGRLGKKPVGVEEYKYFGYNKQKEQAIQNAFIADNQ